MYAQKNWYQNAWNTDFAQKFWSNLRLAVLIALVLTKKSVYFLCLCLRDWYHLCLCVFSLPSLKSVREVNGLYSIYPDFREEFPVKISRKSVSSWERRSRAPCDYDTLACWVTSDTLKWCQILNKRSKILTQSMMLRPCNNDGRVFCGRRKMILLWCRYLEFAFGPPQWIRLQLSWNFCHLLLSQSQ